MHQETFDHAEGDLFPTPNRDSKRLDEYDDRIINQDKVLYLECDPGDYANEQLKGDLDAEVVTANFVYDEDRRNIVPNWDVNTPKAKQLHAMANPPDNIGIEPKLASISSTVISRRLSPFC